MGSASSSNAFERNDADDVYRDPYWISDARSPSGAAPESNRSQNRNSPEPHAKLDSNETVSARLSEENNAKLDEFRAELERKREQRKAIIEEKRKEMEELKAEIDRLKRENDELKSPNINPSGEMDRLLKENEELKNLLKEKCSIVEESEFLANNNRELKGSITEMQDALRRLNVEVSNFDKERENYKKHVVALKDVIAVSKNMLQIRESQLKELKKKVEIIEQTLADKEMNVMSDGLRQEYERQIANMKRLKDLYEERRRAERREKDEISSQLQDAKKDLELQNKKISELEARISELELDNSNKYDSIKSLELNLGLSKAENRQYQEELSVINQLFSETLLKYNTSQELDLDKLQKQLEDHHGLLKDIVINEVSSEVSYALPKVLLELINQLNDVKDTNINEQTESTNDPQASSTTTTRHEMNSAEEIVQNLPKVWRVLIELLSHQILPNNILTYDEETNENPCYKEIETAKGTSLVLSVSQTFIRLKDLIVEKKSLEKETAHLKHLNGHLENRLQDQEKRLELVQNELSKTWLVVGKLQKQHHLLHTQEKILRYELAQKRKLLNELKAELEYSREKWTQAREKNTTTEEQWKQLRKEFASRKNTTTFDEFNNSAESGYSDDREGSSDDEPGYETDVSECDKKIPVASASNENAGAIVEDVELSSTEDQPAVSSTSLIPDEANSSELSVNVSTRKDEESKDSVVLECGSKNPVASESDTVEGIQEENVPECSSKNQPGTSSSSKVSAEPNSSRVESSLSFDEMIARKEERLRRLEGQTTDLVAQAANTASRSVEISNKLDTLHEIYGESNEPSDNTAGDSTSEE
ncbi:unnamed protein product [Phyllotreta striolata]|uniref:Uncharacterized protein n=1 Tax=Phyllotreta striolata TaxID=444603 RepID=A0A9N9XL07_PHYSR|nr:unnamed protein product [Phyllotreta striolata]